MTEQDSPELISVLVHTEAVLHARGDANRYIDEAQRLAAQYDVIRTRGVMEDGSPCDHIVFTRDNSILKIPLKSPA